MKKIKKSLAFLTAMISVLSISACGSSESSDNGTASATDTETTTSVETVLVSDTSEIEEIADDAQKEIIWMGTYDLNPSRGADKSVEMTLFNNKGGTVITNKVVDSEKFDKLATALLSNKDVPDIFKYEWMAFPSQVLKNMYQPVDDIVDFSDPLWADTKATADQFVLNGKHYVAPVSFSVGTLFMYDQNVIDSNNLDDPYELYQNGEWNWDNWYSMMETFVSGAPDDTVRYGINGWFQPQLIQQTGKTMVVYEDGHFKSNLDDSDIERAEDLIYKIGKNNYIQPDWLGGASNALKDGNILFYCMGPWALTGSNGPKEGDDYRVVPVPKDPNAEGNYMTSDMTAYMWVKGSKANEAVKTWYECCRIANTDPEYLENSKQKFLNANPLWTEDMYQVLQDASSSDNIMVFDYGYGISPLLSDDYSSEDGSCVTRKLYEYTARENDEGILYSWSSLREAYRSVVESELADINKAVDAYQE